MSSLFLDMPSSIRPKHYPTLMQPLIAFPTSIFLDWNSSQLPEWTVWGVEYELWVL